MENTPIPSALDFLLSRLEDVAHERNPSYSVRIICAAAMEEYYSLKLSDLQVENERLKVNHSKLVEALTELMRFEASLRHVMEKGLQYPDNFLQAVDNAKELLESIKQS